MGFQPTEVWQFWQGMLRLPCGLRETEPLVWPAAWRTRANAANQRQAAAINVFANETREGKFSAYLVSNREALQVPRAFWVRSSFIREKHLRNEDFGFSLCR